MHDDVADNGGVSSQDSGDRIGPERRLDDLIELVTRVATARGWTSKLVARDKNNHRYATTTVTRMLPDTYHLVTGTFELTSHPKGSISHRLTSMYDDGFADLVESITTEFTELPWFKAPLVRSRVGDIAAPSPQPDSFEVLLSFLRRFHSVARQMRHRHDDRATLAIEDEYDVQDLLQAVLRGLFDDVRPEEYAPSYAGGGSRIDFVLKREQLAIEVKVASAKLKDKQIGEQLVVDIARYRTHADCRRLVCFVYDPAGHLRNPRGLETDLSGDHGPLRVTVIVVSP